MRGLYYYISFPFAPADESRRMAGEEIGGDIFWLNFLLHTFVVFLLIDRQLPHYSVHFRFDLLFILARLLPTLANTFLLAYLFWVAIPRLFNKNISYTICANVVLVSLLPLTIEPISHLVFPKDYGTGNFPGTVYNCILMSLAFHRLSVQGSHKRLRWLSWSGICSGWHSFRFSA